MPDPPASPPPRWQPVLRRADQAVVGALIAASLGYMALAWLDQLWRRGAMIDIEQSEPLGLEFQVDPNVAPWTELSLLPGVGETLAKRIVESREKDGPFAAHEDLRRVQGIGPRKLEQMRPHLAPLGESRKRLAAEPSSQD